MTNLCLCFVQIFPEDHGGNFDFEETSGSNRKTVSSSHPESNIPIICFGRLTRAHGTQMSMKHPCLQCNEYRMSRSTICFGTSCFRGHAARMRSVVKVAIHADTD